MTPLAAALVAMLIAEGVAPPVAEARVAAVVAACEDAVPAPSAPSPPSLTLRNDGAGGAFTLVALCAYNAFKESRMDPLVCDRERDPDGRATCDRRLRRDRTLGPPRAEGSWQLQRPVLRRFGPACGARTLRDARDLRAGACMFAASITYWRERTATLEAAMSSHAVGYRWRRAPGPIGRHRVAWARRWAR